MTLTSSDKKWIVETVDSRLESKLEDNNDKIEAMFTRFRSDFYDKIDPILKEVQTSREERIIINHRLTKLEDIHQKGKHSLAVV